MVTGRISRVYTEESQEKHSEQAQHSLLSSETQMSPGEVELVNNLQWEGRSNVSHMAEAVTEPAHEMLSYQINSSWLGCEPCHIY